MISPGHPHPSSSRGFSLVEVVLALGILAFAFVAILGLLPAGLTNFRQAMDTSVGSQIAQRIIAEAQQTDFDVLIDEKKGAVAKANDTFRAPKRDVDAVLRYFDEQGNEIVPKNSTNLTSDEKAKIIYHVNVRIMPQSPLPKTNSGGDAPHMATLTIQVANNPSGKQIPVSSADPASATEPARNLFLPTPGVTIQKFAAHVGRNQ